MWTITLQSWVISVFSLDSVVPAVADSDRLTLWPCDGLPLGLCRGGSATEAKLFDFTPGRDHVTPCWLCGWRGNYNKCRAMFGVWLWILPDRHDFSVWQLNNTITAFGSLNYRHKLSYWSQHLFFLKNYENGQAPTNVWHFVFFEKSVNYFYFMPAKWANVSKKLK